MALNFKEKIEYIREFERNKKRILSLFPEGRKIGLRFTDIKNLIGLNQRKTNELLRSLIDEGFLERKKSGGKREIYFSKFSEYKGEFDIWDLMSKIDKISQKNGRILKDDMGGLSGLCSVLAYGCWPYEKLTPLEKEMVFLTLSSIRDAFLNFITLTESIKFRKIIERRAKLPKTCKNIIFGKDAGEIDYAAIDKIYGDSLWNYIFEYYTRIFHMQLTKGYMDIHGLKDLFHILDSATEKIDKEVEKKGPFTAHKYPETLFSQKIPQRLLSSSFFADDIESNAFGIMITPSPRALKEYSDQVGNIIRHKIEFWKNYEYILKKKKVKKCDWNQILPDLHKKRLRREHLMISIVEGLLFRDRLPSKDEEKLMRNDPMLNEVLSKKQISWIIEKTNDLFSRCLDFSKKSEKGTKLRGLKKDPKWFSKEEIQDYDPIEKFVSGIEFDDYWERKGKKIL